MNILIIEDNKETLSFLSHALAEDGFVVDTAEDGQAGLKKSLNNDYDLIILDNILPGKTGKEICAEIRKAGKNTRILMLSVNGDTRVRADILNTGADDFLDKPFSFSELLARIQALLRRPKERKNEILKIRELSLDTINRTVKISGKEVNLTPKEFVLLEYLMRNQNKVISRVQILEHVWDMNADLFTNTVETHILNIRKKIGNWKMSAIIHTVRGAGYKII